MNKEKKSEKINKQSHIVKTIDSFVEGIMNE